MESKAKLLGHPIHPMIIVFPLGLFSTSLGFDIAYLATRNLRWPDIAFWLIAVGIVTGLVAAVFGLIDWMAIPSNTRAKRIGAIHGIGNVVVVVLFAITLGLRWENPLAPTNSAIVISFLAVSLSIATAWLGGELVDRLGVGVDDGANLNATNSLLHRLA